MKRVIINADDYGLHAEVDAAILECFAAGVLCSATLMVNQPGAADAAVRAAQAGLPLGLHLNLTLGRPVSEPEQIASLLDAEGRFVARRELIKRALRRRLDPDHVRVELQAQIARYRELVSEVQHLDSHQHVHAIPRVAEVVRALAQDNDWPLRGLRQDLGGRHLSPLKRLKKWVINRTGAARGEAPNRHLVSVFDFLRPGEFPGLAHYRRLLRAVPEGVCTEWMVHPCRDAAAVSGLTAIGAISEAEYRIMIGAEFKQLLRESGVQLTTHRGAARRQ